MIGIFLEMAVMFLIKIIPIFIYLCYLEWLDCLLCILSIPISFLEITIISFEDKVDHSDKFPLWYFHLTLILRIIMTLIRIILLTVSFSLLIVYGEDNWYYIVYLVFMAIYTLVGVFIGCLKLGVCSWYRTKLLK